MSEKCHSILRDTKGRLVAHVASVCYDCEPGYGIPEHYHPEDQLMFASCGVMTLHAKQGIWVVPPSRAVWIPAGTPHSVQMSGKVAMRTLYFLPRLLLGLPGKCVVMNVSPLLRELIVHACAFGKLSTRVPAQKRVIAILADQLHLADSVALQLPRPSDARAKRIVETLLADPADARTLARLCKDCGASKRTMQRLFLAETNMTFGRWRQQLRLLRGLQLLASGAKVTSAALDAGYSSPSAFVSMFRRQLGTTPARYFAAPRVSVTAALAVN
jgi:AraC-like DNA-binding protein